MKNRSAIDATNVQSEARKHLLKLAREYHCLAILIVFNLPNNICHERNRLRHDRNFGPYVVRNQAIQLRKSLRGLKDEGFHNICILNTPEQVASVEIECTRLWTNLRHEHGPFDIIGDVHGCFDELQELLLQLGYQITLSEDSIPSYQITHPNERRVIFVGDLVDRGPKVPEVLHLVMDMVVSGVAFCVPGNHDSKLQRKLNGRNVHVTHGLAETLEQLAQQPPEFVERVKSENLERLRMRGLGMKRSLAMREFALGVEGLERFMHGDSLRSVHECVFGVLALESEPVDPRL